MNTKTDASAALDYLVNHAARVVPISELETFKAACAILLAKVSPPPESPAEAEKAKPA